MPGWSRVALLLSALCWAGAHGLSLSPEGCPSSLGDHRIVIRAFGQVWTEARCVQAICERDGEISRNVCSVPALPLLSSLPAYQIVNRNPCSLSDGDAAQEFPQCCPRVTCSGCYSQRLGRHFGPDDTWTEDGCLQSQCKVGGDGSVIVHRTTCAPPPYDDCALISEDAAADYPGCCPTYRCPGLCFSKSLERWFSAGEKWTEEGCTRAHCAGTDMVALLPCGLVGVSSPNCRVVEGNDTADYPGCCHRVQCDLVEKPCYDRDLDQHFAVGESWTLPGCSGQATCGEGGAMAAVGCPLQATNTPGCSLDDGELGVPYPQCCPKITCRDCYSQRLARYFGPGDTWTDSHCAESRCHATPYGADVIRLPCGLLGLPPYSDCEVVVEDMHRGDYPTCCALFRCPGRCSSLGRWYSVGEEWTEGCTQARCVRTDQVARLPCPLIRLDPSQPNCRIVDGNADANFPDCCPTVQCDPEEEKPCRATDPSGPFAVGATCAPPPYPDCLKVEEDTTAAYPDCCPTYRCPGRCFSKSLDRWFSVGDEWTEEGCTKTHCWSTGQVRQLPCGLIAARRPGCRVVEGDATADYPGCCHRVQCDPNPYG